MAGNKQIFLPTTVLEESKKRVRWLFSEFDNVIVGISGGKDSTVVFHLVMEIATELNRLPLRVCFVDQEGEWDATINYVKQILYREDVLPMWYQSPFRINNAASHNSQWLNVWGEGEEWIRDKDPISRKEKIPGVDVWDDLFPAIIKQEFGNQKACFIAGVRAEESPRRASALTSQATYKYVTYGKKLNPNQYTFYPIYDWSYTDVWKAIHDHGWAYNSIYDTQYQYGIPVLDMRVSSLFHESSIRNTFYMQEVEPRNYERLARRIAGIDSASKMGAADFYCPEKLPFMFGSWKEYRDYLLENLVTDEKHRAGFRKKFAKMDEDMYWVFGDGLYRRQISSILTNDFGFWKLSATPIPRDKYDEYKRRKKLKREAKAAAKRNAENLNGQRDPDSAP